MCGSVVDGNLGCCVLLSASVGDCCCVAVARMSAAVMPPSLAALTRCGWLDSVACDGGCCASMAGVEDVEPAGADVAAVIASLPAWSDAAGSRWCGGGELATLLTAAGITTCGVTFSGSDGLFSRAGEETEEATDTTDDEEVVRCWSGVGDVEGMPDMEKVDGVGDGERAASEADASMGVVGVGDGAVVGEEVGASKKRDEVWPGGASR